MRGLAPIGAVPSVTAPSTAKPASAGPLTSCTIQCLPGMKELDHLILALWRSQALRTREAVRGDIGALIAQTAARNVRVDVGSPVLLQWDVARRGVEELARQVIAAFAVQSEVVDLPAAYLRGDAPHIVPSVGRGGVASRFIWLPQYVCGRGLQFTGAGRSEARIARRRRVGTAPGAAHSARPCCTTKGGEFRV